MKLLFATTNQGKLEELRALVKGLPLEVLSLEDVAAVEVVEDGLTLEENALKKARAYAHLPGVAALADDTGLCVDALNGQPGVHSARFAGVDGPDAEARYRANNEKLLGELASVPLEKRGAEFQCVLSLLWPGQPPMSVRGVCRGRIAFEKRGGHGFGYDPLFELPELGKTFAELTAEEKNRLSHRARAFQALRPQLEKLCGGAG